MFSLDKFYNILHDNLISQIPHSKSISFYPFGTYDFLNIQTNDQTHRAEYATDFNFFHCYFVDQEPYYESTTNLLTGMPPFHHNLGYYPNIHYGPGKINILTVSEHSAITKQYNYFYTWYYFFHGFAALHWYRDFQYVNSSSFDRFNKVFMCYNHLISQTH